MTEFGALIAGAVIMLVGFIFGFAASSRNNKKEE